MPEVDYSQPSWQRTGPVGQELAATIQRSRQLDQEKHHQGIEEALQTQAGDREAAMWNERMQAIALQQADLQGYHSDLATGMDPKLAILRHPGVIAGKIPAAVFQPQKPQPVPAFPMLNATVAAPSATPSAEPAYVPNAPQTGAEPPPTLTPPTQGNAVPDGWEKVPGTGYSYVGSDGKLHDVAPKFTKKPVIKPSAPVKLKENEKLLGPDGKLIAEFPKALPTPEESLRKDPNYIGLIRARTAAFEAAAKAGDVDTDAGMEAAQKYALANSMVEDYEKAHGVGVEPAKKPEAKAAPKNELKLSPETAKYADDTTKAMVGKVPIPKINELRKKWGIDPLPEQ